MSAVPSPDAVPADPDPKSSNTYVGPVSYLEGQILYGRRREAAELADLLISRRVALLYSPSGAGKTSLIRTRLRREIETRGKGRLRISPVIRVNYLAPGVTCNRYVLSVLRQLENEFAPEQQLDDVALAKFELAQYLEERWGPLTSPERKLYDLLLFDQFEEVFTLDPVDRDAKREFFVALGAALGRRGGDQGDESSLAMRWALFSMREDYLAEIDDYRDLLPTALTTRYRLNLLDRDQAREAIQSPAADAGVEFHDDAVSRVLDELTKVRVSQSGAGAWAQGQFVEPVQLQVVCRRLWKETVGPDKRRIMLEDLTNLDADDSGQGGVDAALSGYFDEQVNAAAKGAAARERVIREWFDSALITPSKLRSQVLRDGDQATAVTPEEIGRLINGHVLRSDKRGGREWVEVTHDRLIYPILWSNNKWLGALAPLLQQSRLWEESGKQDGYLLTGGALAEAERWADANRGELQRRDETFLALSRLQREHAQIEQRRGAALGLAHRRLRRRAWGLALFGLVLLAYALRSHFQRLELVDLNAANVAEQRLSRIVVTLSQADRKLQSDYRLALERIMEADGLLTDAQKALQQRSAPQALQALDQSVLESLRDAPALLRRFLGLQPHQGPGDMEQDLVRERVSADASLLEALRAVPPIVGRFAGHKDAIRALAMGEDGATMVSAGNDGSILLWDRARAVRRGTGIDARVSVYSLAYHSASGLVAAGDGAGTIGLWRFAPDGSVQALATLNADRRVHGQRITGLAFDPSGKVLAASSWDRHVALWDVRDPATASAYAQFGAKAHGAVVYALAFNRDGSKLATADWNGRVLVWDALPEAGRPGAMPSMLELAAEKTQGGPIALNTVAFSPDSRFVAAGGHDGSVLLWPLAAPAEGRRLRGAGGHDAPVFGVAFSPDGRLLASVGLDKTLILWNTDEAAVWKPIHDLPVHRHIPSLPERLYAVAFQPDAPNRIAVGGARTVFMLDAAGPASPLAQTMPGSRLDLAAAKQAAWEGVELARNGTLVLATRGAQVWAWDLTGPQPRTIGEPALVHEGLASFTAGAAGNHIVTGSKSGEVFLWSNDNGSWRSSVILAAGAGSEQVNAVALSKDSNLVAAAVGNKLYVWRVGDGGAARQILAEGFDTARVRTIAFSPTEDVLAAGGTGMPLRLWRAQGAQMIAAMSADSARQTVINDIAFAQDGQTLVTGDEDMRVVEWNLPPLEQSRTAGDQRSSKPLAQGRTFGEHERGVRSVVHAARGGRPVIFSVDRDANVVVRLSLDDDRHTRTLLSGYGRNVLISADARGERLVATGEDVTVWDMRPAMLRRVACGMVPSRSPGGADPCAPHRP